MSLMLGLAALITATAICGAFIGHLLAEEQREQKRIIDDERPVWSRSVLEEDAARRAFGGE